MFTPEQNYARNKAWAKPGAYQTQLMPDEESAFKLWAKSQNINEQDYTGDTAVYDMRGFYKAMRAGDPRATSSINLNDKQRHYPDIWKTPYAATFSNESMYALPTAPRWVHQGGSKWNYALPSGHVIYDDHRGKWYGLPNANSN